MKIIAGQLKRLGQSTSNATSANYSVIEIGEEHLTSVEVGLGLSNYLNSALGKECTLHVVQKRFIIALDFDGKRYVIKGLQWAAFVRMVIAGFFSLIILILALANFILYLFSPRDTGHMFGAFFFGIFAFFVVRAFLRNRSVYKGSSIAGSQKNVIPV